MESTNKKRTAVVAAATAAALVLSGTFAWNMATDQTKLNEFSESDKGNYGVELKENFDPNDPWANKDVYVTNTEDNPVIVRVRLEEFYDLTYRNGTEYNKPEGYANRDADGSAIFTPDAGDTLNDDKTADSATKLNEKISLLFGAGVVTMAEYNAMDADAKAAVKWVVDTDGWCYYTQALLAGETTEYLLDKATFNKDVFDAAYDSPYNLDYRINVRLQAISADLEDFGSHLNDMQWTNVAYIDADGNEVTDNAGRVITEDERADNYEITADSTITDEAMALVTGIAYPFATPYTEGFKNADGSVAKRVSTWAQLRRAVQMENAHTILVTNDLVADSPLIVYNNDVMIDFGEYTVTRGSNYSGYLMLITNGRKLVLKHGTIEDNSSTPIAVGVDLDNGLTTKESVETLELAGMNITTAGDWNPVIKASPNDEISIYSSNLTTNPYPNILLENGDKIRINGSNTNDVIVQNGQVSDIELTIENNSKLVGGGVTDIGKGWTVNVSDSVLKGGTVFQENHDWGPPTSVNINNTIINTSKLAYYKVSDSPLKMTNCTINVEAEANSRASGLFLRSGDITLDNVTVNVNRGEGIDNVTGPFVRNQRSYNTLDAFYSNEMGACTENYEALQVVLNSYESINLNIIGGSYKTNVADANSVYVFDATTGTQNGTLHWNDGYDYNNTITISGDPTFTPATTAFDTDYANTTIIKND